MCAVTHAVQFNTSILFQKNNSTLKSHRNVVKSTSRSVLKSRVVKVSALSVVMAEQQKIVEEYNRRMTQKMDNPYEYHPERGLYYHYITNDIIVGSQPQTVDDITRLATEEGVACILNLQQDKDLHYWNVDLKSLMDRADHHGIDFVRIPHVVDFDPNSLRATLPQAVAALEKARLVSGKVYVHCTAGLGRSPAVAIASLYWFSDLQLDEAYQYLTSIRPCGPNRDAIRGATHDLLRGGNWNDFHHMPNDAFAYLSDDDRQVLRNKLLGDS